MHTTKERDKLLARVRRLRGQIEAIERSIESEASCGVVLHQIAGARGAMAGLMAAVVEDHITGHLVDSAKFPDALDRAAVDDLLDVVRAYLK
ncbi:metal/formaldehyde-sensitive transcriptional repressor [Sphingomonas sp. UYP23]